MLLQLYSAQAAFVNGGATQARSFAKVTASDRPPVNGDDLLKGIFFEVKKKFETALGVLKKEKVTIDPDDPAAVARYAEVMKTVREKAGLFSDSQRIKYTIETFTNGIPDARTYLNTLQEIRVKSGLIDHLGIEPLMMEAVEKIEKDIKKPLLRNDKKNMATLMAEFDKINKKYASIRISSLAYFQFATLLNELLRFSWLALPRDASVIINGYRRFCIVFFLREGSV